jgi:glycerophosphoryl diester phosphodiesterase
MRRFAAALAALLVGVTPVAAHTEHTGQRCEAPALVAHRGAGAGANENTPIGVYAAAVAGADAVELDTRANLNGTEVLAHDTVRYRPALWRGLRVVADAGLPLWLEIKDGDAQTVADVLAALNRHNLADETVVQSFSPTVLRRVHRVQPGQATALLRAAPHPDPAAAAAAAHAEWLGLSTAALLQAPGQVAAAHSAGVKVAAWTPNRPRRWAALTDLGVDAIITDEAASYAVWAGCHAAA